MTLKAERAGSSSDREPDAEARQRVALLLRDNAHLFRQAFRRRLKARGVTLAEARTLMYLCANQGIAQGRLADILEVQPIALTRVIDRLAEAGWVERRLSEKDRRLRLLFTTPSGSALVKRLHQLSGELAYEITEGLSAEEMERLSDGLADINGALRQLK